jgi:hypothetical protein
LAPSNSTGFRLSYKRLKKQSWVECWTIFNIIFQLKNEKTTNVTYAEIQCEYLVSSFERHRIKPQQCIKAESLMNIIANVVKPILNPRYRRIPLFRLHVYNKSKLFTVLHVCWTWIIFEGK